MHVVVVVHVVMLAARRRGNGIAGIGGECGLGGAVDVAEWYTGIAGETCTIFELGRERRLQAGAPGAFATDLAPGRRDFHNVALLNAALDLQAADAERARFGEHNVFAACDEFGTAENAQHNSRTIFLHLHWGDENIHCAGGLQTFADVTDGLPRHVVEIRFQQNNVFRVCRNGGRADEDSQHVGPFRKRLRSTAAADGFDRHRGHRAETVCQSLRDRGTCRRRQFRLDRNVGKRNTLENLRRAGCRNRTNPVINFDEPTPCWNRVADDSINSQQVKCDGHADDIDDRINRPDFVKVDFLNRRSMHAGFGFGHSQKHLQRQMLLRRGQASGLFDDATDVGEVPMSVLFGMIDHCLQRSKTALDNSFNAKDDIWQIE